MKTLLAAISLLTLVSCYSEADYEYVGSYPYEIVNDSLLENTCFHENYRGFCVVTDLEFEEYGIKWKTPWHDRAGDYLVSVNHPVEHAYKDSPLTRHDGLEYLKEKPLDVRLDTTKTEKKIFVYRLKPVNHYRTLGP